VVGEKSLALSSERAQSKVTWPLGKRRLNVYSLCRSGNPPPAPQSGSEIRRSICSADGALRGAIGVFGNQYLCNPTSTKWHGQMTAHPARSMAAAPGVIDAPRRRLLTEPPRPVRLGKGKPGPC
jgi:hypothetical protein